MFVFGCLGCCLGVDRIEHSPLHRWKECIISSHLISSSFPDNGIDDLGRTVVGSNVALDVRSRNPSDARNYSGVQ